MSTSTCQCSDFPSQPAIFAHSEAKRAVSFTYQDLIQPDICRDLILSQPILGPYCKNCSENHIAYGPPWTTALQMLSNSLRWKSSLQVIFLS